MNKSADRISTVRSLVRLSKSLKEIEADLKQFIWDFKGSPYIAMRSDIIGVLEMYDQGRIDRAEIEKWANMIEGREDVEFEAEYREKLLEVVYILANPVLQGELTRERASEMIRSLKACARP
ncbi:MULTISPECIES: hypothetical protein [unclassified Chelatococcus]|uniref:hypothetical protein n=1 Tax=unclassified Chelatococcus TaxID=2638111 RepID=UPI0012E229E1|nr:MULTISPECIES: hypothetical protein [unclassified Chelatococcus]